MSVCPTCGGKRPTTYERVQKFLDKHVHGKKWTSRIPGGLLIRIHPNDMASLLGDTEFSSVEHHFHSGFLFGVRFQTDVHVPEGYLELHKTLVVEEF